MRETAGSAAAAATNCRQCLREDFMASLSHMAWSKYHAGTQITSTVSPTGRWSARHGRPADDSIDQCEFVVNLEAAKAFGLTMPAGLLAIADEVIE